VKQGYFARKPVSQHRSVWQDLFGLWVTVQRDKDSVQVQRDTEFDGQEPNFIPSPMVGV
jgi:hypothetical protein